MVPIPSPSVKLDIYMQKRIFTSAASAVGKVVDTSLESLFSVNMQWSLQNFHIKLV